MAIVLRNYQEEAVGAILGEWDKGNLSTLAVLATGAGKTQIALATISEEFQRGRVSRVLALSHRYELVHQPRDRVIEHWQGSIPVPGIVMANEDECDSQFIVATVQSLSEKRLQRALLYGSFSHVWADEAHHSLSKSWFDLIKALRNANPNLRLLGTTATPKRTDKRGLTQVFDSVAYRLNVKDAIQIGALCPFVAMAVELPIDFSGLKKTKHGWDDEEMGKLLSLANAEEIITQTWLKHASDRQTLAFTASVLQAKSLMLAFRAMDIEAETVNDSTPKQKRADILSAYRRGDIQLVTNFGVLTEGYDAPETSCVLMARPTKSDLVYLQCLDAQTEILTPNGWKGFNEVRQGDMVAGFDRETEEIRWVRAIEYYQRPLGRDEKMVEYKSPHLDIRVTDGHNLLIQNRKTRSKTWNLVSARNILNRLSEFRMPVAGVQEPKGVPLSLTQLKFIGIWLTDGTRNKINGQISISQAEHQPQNKDIVECLDECGFSYRISRIEKEDQRTQFNANSASLRYVLHRGRRGEDQGKYGYLNSLDVYLDKDLSPLLDDMTPEQLAALLVGVNIGNGAKHRKITWNSQTYDICFGNRKVVERLQSLCVRRGFKANVYEDISPYGNPRFMLHIKSGIWRAVGGANCSDKPTFSYSHTMPNEVVWCVENELSTLVTRRNGKVAIMGNCVGRGLRTAPGKQSCLILDFAPRNARDMRLAGNLLGKPKEQRQQEERAEKSGLVLSCFGINSRGEGIDGDPDEIQMRVLDYLGSHHLAWTYDGGLATVSIAEKTSLVVVLPQQDRISRAVELRQLGNWRPEWESEFLRISGCQVFAVSGSKAILLGVSSDWEGASTIATRYADTHAEDWCSKKQSRWRKTPATVGQEKYCRALGVWRDGMTRGGAGQAITHARALAALRAEGVLK